MLINKKSPTDFFNCLEISQCLQQVKTNPIECIVSVVCTIKCIILLADVEGHRLYSNHITPHDLKVVKPRKVNLETQSKLIQNFRNLKSIIKITWHLESRNWSNPNDLSNLHWAEVSNVEADLGIQTQVSKFAVSDHQ